MEKEIKDILMQTDAISEIATGVRDTDKGFELQEALMTEKISRMRFTQLTIDLSGYDVLREEKGNLSDEDYDGIIAETDSEMKKAYGFHDTARGRMARKAYLKGAITSSALFTEIG